MQPEISTVEQEENSESSIGQNQLESFRFKFSRFLAAPIAACEKLDQIFGSGAEAIVHLMWFEQGKKLFESMSKDYPERTSEELLKLLIGECPKTGLGLTKMTVVRNDLPVIELIIKKSPVKTVKGSQKHLLGSFWAGILSVYWKKQLTPRNFNYNKEKDEFLCLIAAQQSLK